MNFKFKTAAVAAISVGAIVLASAQTTSTSCFQFTQNMKLGSSGAQVLELQKSLNSMGFTVATTGAGSMGNESTYFGMLTKNAAIKYQTSVNLPAYGNVFAMTRAILNACGTGGTTGGTGTGTGTGTVNSGPVSVSLSSMQPSNVIVSGSARAKLADFVFSGNGSVVSVKLMRNGVSNNNTLSNVYLYDASTGMRLTDAASVLTDGTVTFNSASGLFMVGGSKTVSVLADVASSTSGQTVGFSVTGYTVTGSAAAVVSGVNGPVLPIAAADLATATFASTTPATTSMNAGTTGATVWSSSLNVGIRAVNLSSMTFKMVGSAPVDALANVKLYVDGVQFANASAFSANGYVTFYSMSPLALTTGSHTFDVRADIVKGSSRSFYVSIENAGDIALQDSQLYGANVSVKYNGNIISNLLAGTITITGGSLTISQNSAFNTSSLVGGSTNQTLGSFKFYAYGEDVKVQYLTINATATATLSPTSTKLNNVTVYVNGGAVSSGIQATLGANQTISLGSNLIIPAGSSAIVEVKGDLVNENNANITSGTVRVDVVSSGSTAQGQYSYNTITVPAATGQGLSINSGNVSFGATSGFTAANISKNQAMVKIASFSLQAGSAEAINVTNINILLNGSSTPASEYTNLKITDGSQTVVPTSGTNNFSVNYDVAAGSTKTIEVWVDTLEIANGKTIIASSTVTYRGKTSSVTNTVSATAPAMTAATVS
nr:peptidoglycan-binding protein [Candidatus Paceibacterota bacterium]